MGKKGLLHTPVAIGTRCETSRVETAEAKLDQSPSTSRAAQVSQPLEKNRTLESGEGAALINSGYESANTTEAAALIATEKASHAVESLVEQMAAEFKIRLTAIMSEVTTKATGNIQTGMQMQSADALTNSERQWQSKTVNFGVGGADNGLPITLVNLCNEEQNDWLTSSMPQTVPEVASREQDHAPGSRWTSATPLNIPVSRPYEYVKLVDLPKFSGDPLEWPMFERSFIDTTVEFGYSGARNITRLRHALTGEARIAVESMLPFPDSVADVMATLKENFGRPEQLVNCQLAKVRRMSHLQSGDFSGIVSLANAVRNMTAMVKYAGVGHRLCDMTLLTELVAKLPCEVQLQWAEYKERLPSYATIEDLSAFLNIIAKRANAIKDSLPKYPTRDLSRTVAASTAKGGQRKHTLIAQVESKSCVVCGGACMSVSVCAAFEKMQMKERWAKAKAHRLCFSCLKAGHGVEKCFKKKKCQLDGCNEQHHKLLHGAVDANNSTETVYCGKAQSDDSEVWFQIVPVEVRANGIKVRTFAFLDPGSSHTMVEWSLAKKLGLKGSKETLAMHWLGGVKAENTTERVSFEICGLEKGCSPAKLSKVYTVREMDLPK